VHGAEGEASNPANAHALVFEFVCVRASPIESSQCVKLDIWHTADAMLSAGSFHHCGLMR
tara:strand:- start:667 stop:846 length:180 start_codon:yes stop_codon:yes gene_type:complete